MIYTRLLYKKLIRSINIKRNYATEEKAICQLLSDQFGLNAASARYLVYRYRMATKQPERILDAINMCKQLGYSSKEILYTPEIITTHPLIIEQRYLTMEEGGFALINPKIIYSGRRFMYQMVTYLKSLEIIKQDTNVAESFLQYIKEIPPNFKLAETHDDMTWHMIHDKLLKEYLKCRLNATDDDIVKLFRTHKMIQNKSFRVIQENIELAEELGFTPDKIIKYGYILHNYPKYTKTVLNDLSDLAGADWRVAIRQYPKLIMINPKNILKIYGILKEFNIPDETIRKKMNVFEFNPETVRFRLEEIQKTPELRVLLQNPNVLNLVVHHNKARSRLSFLQQIKLRCLSLNILGASVEDVFTNYIQEGQDLNNLHEVLLFLKSLFNENIKTFEKRWKIHPHHQKIPLVDMEKTFNYLKREKFRTSAIYHVMHILLYPKNKIDKALKQIKKEPTLKKSLLTQEDRLNLVLYYIEKDHHFTGNGVWPTDVVAECDSEDRTLE